MGGDPRKRNENLNKTIGNVYIGATDKKENGDIKKPEDWITLNTDLKDYSNERYNNRSKCIVLSFRLKKVEASRI